MFSFNFLAANKADAIEIVKTRMAAVAADQPVHARDVGTAVGAAEALIGLLDDTEGKKVYVRMSGSINGDWTDEKTISVVRGAELTIHAGLEA